MTGRMPNTIAQLLRSYADAFSSYEEGLTLAPENWNSMRELMIEAADAICARSAGGLFDQDKVKRLLAVMECDTLDDAIMEAEFDVKESVAAALAIKRAAGHPEQVWPSPHERRFFIALKDEAARAAHSATERTDAERYRFLKSFGEGHFVEVVKPGYTEDTDHTLVSGGCEMLDDVIDEAMNVTNNATDRNAKP